MSGRGEQRTTTVGEQLPEELERQRRASAPTLRDLNDHGRPEPKQTGMQKPEHWEEVNQS